MDEKTIRNGLEHCLTDEPCTGQKFITCPFSPRNNPEQNCGRTMARSILALLREQDGFKHYDDGSTEP